MDSDPEKDPLIEGLAGSRSEEDGADPRDFFRKSSRSNQVHRKQDQLCEQIREALYWILGEEVGDDSLALYQVISITPISGDNRVQVILGIPKDEKPEEALAKLRTSYKTIRAKVAESINRRKVPDLNFDVIPLES